MSSLVKHNNVRFSINKSIKAVFPSAKIYGEEIKENMTPPAFFVKFLEVTQDKELHNRYRRTYPVVIHYFSDVGTNEDMYEVAETLTDAIKSVKYDGRNMYGRDVRFQISDGILYLYVTYDLLVYEEKETGVKLKDYDMEVIVKYD